MHPAAVSAGREKACSRAQCLSLARPYSHCTRSLLRPVASTATRRSAAAFHTDVRGEEGTDSYRMFYTEGGADISPWHGIPLSSAPGTFNFLNEIPKMTKKKMEVSTKEAGNPIAQDIKKGKLREYHGPIFWNYGCLPQTWEDPSVKHESLGCFGDGDPIDAVEIGSQALASGAVAKVRPLGVLAMIDEGELDWKLIVINVDDPLAASLHDVSDVEAQCDGVLTGIREWFRWYKTPDDKPINSFGFDEAWLDAKTAVETIEETNHQWKALIAGETEQGKMWIK